MEASGEPPQTLEAEASGEPPSDVQPAARRPGSTENGGKVPRPSVAWGNVVVDTLKIKDPAGLARRLRSELELGDGRTEYGRVLEALDRCARNLDDAGRLHRAAKLEEETYTLDRAERLEIMRSSALAELMGEYKAKARPSPTQKDVEDRMLANWPEEYRTIRARLAELHAAVRSLETLRDAWASRCADLRIMADKARPIR